MYPVEEPPSGDAGVRGGADAGPVLEVDASAPIDAGEPIAPCVARDYALDEGRDAWPPVDSEHDVAVGAFAGDFDGDGADELVTLRLYPDGQSELLRLTVDAAGDVHAEPVSPLSRRRFFARPYCDTVAVDYNRDSHLDIFSCGTVVLGLGDGTFGETIDVSAGCVADLDGDGWFDWVDVYDDEILVGWGSEELRPSSAVISRFPVTGFGGMHACLVRDVNADGLTDILCTSSSGLHVLLAEPGRQLASSVIPTPSMNPGAPFVYDAEGDGSSRSCWDWSSSAALATDRSARRCTRSTTTTSSR